MIDEILELMKARLNELKDRYPIKNIFIFGSYARGEEKSDSDVDVLVELSEPIGLRFVELADDLEDIVGKKVDLVSKNSIKDKMMMRIKEELIEVNA